MKTLKFYEDLVKRYYPVNYFISLYFSETIEQAFINIESNFSLEVLGPQEGELNNARD